MLVGFPSSKAAHAIDGTTVGQMPKKHLQRTGEYVTALLRCGNSKSDNEALYSQQESATSHF